MYKININEQCMILCLSAELNDVKSKENNSLPVLFRGRKRQFYPYIDSMEKHIDNQTVIFHSEDLKGMYKLFKSVFRVIRAAGGIVRNQKGKILFIYRRGHWDLPKGKIDLGEKKKAAALREVKEETGVSNLKIIDKVGKSYHVYKDKQNRRCLKLTHWYRMISNDKNLCPQLEEDIDLAQWDSREQILLYPEPIYSSINNILSIEEEMNQNEAKNKFQVID